MYTVKEDLYNSGVFSGDAGDGNTVIFEKSSDGDYKRCIDSDGGDVITDSDGKTEAYVESNDD